MSKLKILILLSYLFTFGLLAADVLTVEVTNIKKVKGTMNLALYDSAKSFGASSDVDSSLKTERTDVNDKKMVFTFKDLPKGKYAVNVFQDMNGNQKVDTNFVGMPKEPFGFSQNFKPRFGPPDFEDVVFDYNGGEKIIKISLIH